MGDKQEAEDAGDWSHTHRGLPVWKVGNTHGCLAPGYILSATLHIVASVRAPCPTCSRPPCLVRMLYEPFTQR
eukprot:3949630-Prymnesium_polylepis.1